ncbi:MAG: 16S rRNA (adenine(1518)-N(6)/adenine(1519)-N(6))-dimethyltransferase RsmA [Elusimicrobia bacterium]|nr:16S rRNA (adenine(1518)-N(6)/adenine(1519)-N(6))-dimethyltransferase RsmA [Elusimicrobiota bacterium]
MPKYSQVFLKNDYTALKIAESVNDFDCDLVVEIGPGKGVLTKDLIKLYPKKLLLIEIDGRMIEFLKDKFKGDIPRIIKADFMRLDLSEVFLKNKKIVFIGNLPYHCATAILEKALLFDKFVGASFMFQKEMAQRIMARPNDKDYGYFSIFSQVLSEAFVLIDAPKSDFSPVPKIDSRVVVFKKEKDPFFKPLAGAVSRGHAHPRLWRGKQTAKKGDSLKNFLSLIKFAFSHRRKTILNSLSISMNMDKALLLRIFEKAQIEPQIRPQNLSIEDFKRLYKEFNSDTARQ